MILIKVLSSIKRKHGCSCGINSMLLKYTLLTVKVPYCFTLNQMATLGIRKTESLLIKTKARCLHTDNKQFMFAAAAIIK